MNIEIQERLGMSDIILTKWRASDVEVLHLHLCYPSISMPYGSTARSYSFVGRYFSALR